ncbi:caspase-3-like [Xenia sp. Carnegie-2017]|uniref:caspase-3-like n=1 Tax=Xenia sp. Carnegie-2017 TaxID=2897299 RepID=UPI001F04878B|nr:caspase-3-like [Xenia sp. Carnegie-2017]
MAKYNRGWALISRFLETVWLWLQMNVSHMFGKRSSLEPDKDDDKRRPTSSTSGVYDTIDGHQVGTSVSVLGDLSRRTKPSIRKEIVQRGNALHVKNPYCIVLINTNFDHKSVPRNGASADRQNIKRFLNAAGFNTIHFYDDLERKDTLELMEKISSSTALNGHDGLMVFISSYGKKKGILTKDRKVIKTEELTSRVNGNQCEALRGKPKLFFISACRGKKADPGHSGVIDHDAGGNDLVVPKLPTEADFLVCYCSVSGYISMRRFALNMEDSTEMGMWFISVLTQVFEERMEDDDVMQMLAVVNARVADMATGNDHKHGKKQMPVQMHMLRHRVFLGKNE